MAIDVHGHFTPPVFLTRLAQRSDYPRVERSGDSTVLHAGPRSSFVLDPAQVDLDRRRQALQTLGYERQLVSLSAAYGFDRLQGSEAVDMALAVNDGLRTAAALDRDRYQTLAVAPPGDSGVDVLRAALAAGQRGMILSSSTITRLESFEPLAPLIAQAHQADAIVFVHPGSDPLAAGLPATRLAVSGVAFQNELTAALLRLLDWGCLARFPGLRLLFCNLGGTMPFLLERWRHFGGAELLPQLQAVTYDCSSFGPRGIELAVAALGADRIVVGTDYPIQPLERPLDALAQTSLSETERERIRSGNAACLLAID